MTVVFAVTSEVQLEAANAVAAELAGRWACWNPVRCQPHDPGISVGSRVIRSGYWAALRTAQRTTSFLREHRAQCYVAGQDMALCERAAIAAAVRTGVPVVLLPDGLAMSGAHPTAGSAQIIKNVVDRVASALGLLAGRRGVFGGSDPRLILSWGPGWEPLWRMHARSAAIVNAGSPRSDWLMDVPAPPGAGNVLVCSQRLDTFSSVTAAYEPKWHDWLQALVATGSPRVRVRLHPAESGTALARSIAEVGGNVELRPLAEDLAWADAIVSPFSTVLLEGWVCGRAPRTVDVGIADVIERVPPLRSMPWTPLVLGSEDAEPDALVAWAKSASVDLAAGQVFLRDPGRSARRAADAIGHVVEAERGR